MNYIHITNVLNFWPNYLHWEWPTVEYSISDAKKVLALLVVISA